MHTSGIGLNNELDLMSTVQNYKCEWRTEIGLSNMDDELYLYLPAIWGEKRSGLEAANR